MLTISKIRRTFPLRTNPCSNLNNMSIKVTDRNKERTESPIKATGKLDTDTQGVSGTKYIFFTQIQTVIEPNMSNKGAKGQATKHSREQSPQGHRKIKYRHPGGVLVSKYSHCLSTCFLCISMRSCLRSFYTLLRTWMPCLHTHFVIVVLRTFWSHLRSLVYVLYCFSKCFFKYIYVRVE